MNEGVDFLKSKKEKPEARAWEMTCANFKIFNLLNLINYFQFLLLKKLIFIMFLVKSDSIINTILQVFRFDSNLSA